MLGGRPLARRLGFQSRARYCVAPNAFGYPAGDYGSLLRDLAGTTALAAESGEADLVPALLQKSQDVDMTLNATTTQEKAWMLRAAYALTRQKLPLNIAINGQPATPRAGAVRLSPSTGAARRRTDACSTAAMRCVWRTTSVQGTPMRRCRRSKAASR